MALNPGALIARVAQSIFVSLLSISLFYGIGRDQNKAQELVNSIFFTCIAQLALYETATVMEFQTERNVFVRENASKLYTSFAYFSSKVALELPLLLVFPLLENVMIFWAIGYRDGSFWQFLLVYVLTAQIGTSIGYFISSIFDNMMSAAQITPFAVMPSVLFGGLIVNLDTLSSWISWFKWTSPTYFAFQGLVWA